MDFEQWLRAQLAAGPEPLGREPQGRRRPTPARLTLALQLLAVTISLAVIAIGLSSVGSLPTLQIRVLAQGGAALPVDTWAGVPPPPADATPAVAEIPAPTTAVTAAVPVPVRTPDDRGAHAPTSPPASSGEPEHSSPSPPPTGDGMAPTPSTPAASASSAFSLKGGTVTASCRGGRIFADSVTPNPDFESEVENRDGGRVIEVRFRSDIFESELQIWCSAGLVQSQIREGAR